MKCSYCERDRVSRCSYSDCPFEVEEANAIAASLRAELAASRERERALERERDEAQALADWYHRTGNEAAERIWAVLIREPYREGGENMLGRVVELKARAEAAEAEVNRLQSATIEALTKANERLPGVETPVMRGDNLAIVLCSAFDDGDRETEDDTGWSEAARTGYEEVIAAIREHYLAAIRALADANTQGGDKCG